tara:strand:- start:1508 stop:2656 length:1149 start_codon:yes stop_codon:yes gene_type:complete
MPKRKIIKTDKPYRLKQVRGVWNAIDKKTGKAKSLKIQGTREEAEALADIEWSETDDTNAAFHKKTAEAHLAKCNPVYVTTTWRMLYDDYKKAPAVKSGVTKRKGTLACLESFWSREELDGLRDARLIDTTPKQILDVANKFTRAYQDKLKTLCKYALDYDYIPYRLMPDGMWPKRKATKPMSRAVDIGEHEKLIQAFGNKKVPYWKKIQGRGIAGNVSHDQFINEWRDYLNLLWFVGCSNADGADMTAENINERLGCLEFTRRKWSSTEARTPVRVPICPQLRTVLKRRPKSGLLFPYLSGLGTSMRNRIFKWYVNYLNLPKVSIHGYRYAMAERLHESGASLEDRQMVLGHAAAEMAEHYAKNSDYVPRCVEIIDGAKAA